MDWFRAMFAVLLPSKITLLSNHKGDNDDGDNVLLPSKITLLSNNADTVDGKHAVLLPSKITLLSNKFAGRCFFQRFYYPLK